MRRRCSREAALRTPGSAFPGGVRPPAGRQGRGASLSCRSGGRQRAGEASAPRESPHLPSCWPGTRAGEGEGNGLRPSAPLSRVGGSFLPKLAGSLNRRLRSNYQDTEQVNTLLSFNVPGQSFYLFIVILWINS